jgi:hypothetical protein
MSLTVPVICCDIYRCTLLDEWRRLLTRPGSASTATIDRAGTFGIDIRTKNKKGAAVATPSLFFFQTDSTFWIEHIGYLSTLCAKLSSSCVGSDGVFSFFYAAQFSLSDAFSRSTLMWSFQ